MTLATRRRGSSRPRSCQTRRIFELSRSDFASISSLEIRTHVHAHIHTYIYTHTCAQRQRLPIPSNFSGLISLDGKSSQSFVRIIFRDANWISNRPSEKTAVALVIINSISHGGPSDKHNNRTNTADVHGSY